MLKIKTNTQELDKQSPPNKTQIKICGYRERINYLDGTYAINSPCQNKVGPTSNFFCEKCLKIVKEELQKIIPPEHLTVDFGKIPKILQNYFYDNILTEKRGLYLHGECGVGKSYAVCAMARQLILRSRLVKVVDLLEVLHTIRMSFNNKQNGDYIKELIDVDYLILDDIGTENTTDWTVSEIQYLVNERCKRQKLTIFTSNLDLEKLGEKIGDRISSRIMGMCEIIKLEGKDRRMK